MTESAPLYNELAEAPETGRAFWLTSGRRRIRAAIWDEGTRGTVLIFTGRTEYIEKYGRVISLLVERGFSVATLDWRGQGLSERPLGDRMKGHVGASPPISAISAPFSRRLRSWPCREGGC